MTNITDSVLRQQLDILRGNIDRKTGAPYNVRSAVGAAPNDDSRLATVRRFFPDAAPTGDGNFIYTDPRTGQRKLYNPPGLDVGDVASVGREIAGAAGGAIGAAAAAPSGPVGIAAGIGLGATAGEQTYQALSGARDTRDVAATVRDLSMSVGLNAVAPGLGNLAAQQIRRGIGPARRYLFGGRMQDVNPQQAANQFGIDLPAGAATANPAVQRAEGALRAFPPSAPVVDRAIETAVAQSDGANRAMAQGVANASGRTQALLSREGLGRGLKTAAETGIRNFETRREALDVALNGAIGAGTAVPVARLAQLQTQLQGELARAPTSLAPRYQAALQRLDGVLNDAAQSGGAVPFDVVRALRTDVGKEAGWAVPGGTNPVGVPALQRLYGELSETISEAATSAGPAAQEALRRHDAFVSSFRAAGGPGAALMDFANPDALPGRVMSLAMSGARQDAKQLAYLRSFAEPGQWDQIAGSTLRQMGFAPLQTGAGAQREVFSPAVWLSNWESMTEGARRTLFSGTRFDGTREALDSFARVMASMRDAASREPRGSSAMLGTLAMMGGGGVAGSSLGDAVTGLAGGLATSLFGNVSARLLESRPFVRWLTSTARLPADNVNSVAAQLARLGAVAQANPELRNEIETFRNSVIDALPQQ
jgi:hypothetical protein